VPLREEFTKSGDWLFRRRSYLPPFLMLVILFGISQFEYPGRVQNESTLWEIICLSVAVLGQLVRVFTIGFTPRNTSGTNTGQQMAHFLNTSGIYSQVRHPLYLGNFLMWMGLFMFFRTWWLCLIIGLVFWLYYERIMFTEEEFLRTKFGTQYVDWASRTPPFFPAFRNWKKPELSFSIKKAVRNEYQSAFAMLVSFSLVNFITDSYIARQAVFDKRWLAALAGGAILYFTLRTLKKKTHLFEQEGR
jgi:protein-S-isoprenylcysteine O-methyltransferase Ste14